MRPSKKWLGIPVASRLPVAEGETMAIGVSTRVLEVMDVGSLRTEASVARGGRCSHGSGGRDLGSWGLYSCAQSGGWRYVQTVASRSIGAEGSLMKMCASSSP